MLALALLFLPLPALAGGPVVQIPSGEVELARSPYTVKLPKGWVVRWYR